MYLKRLEMHGFKSFADKTILEFKPGITSVIGPNGSGKSNISDCIRWILGEQSMKSLRGSKSEDIIFAGTQNRKALGYAEGSLVIDNEDGKLPIEYNEVTITRRLYRTGETGYFINKTPCRLKDVLELFMDTGIGKDGYSIIGQGKIDEILSNKSEDRRRIFEEAAGIVKYRTRKQESERKLEQTKLNLLRINDIITEIEANMEPLKEQSERAKKFLNLREELKNFEVGLFLYNIENYKKQMNDSDSNMEIYNDQKAAEDDVLKTIQEDRDNLRLYIENLIEEIENTQNLGSEGNQKREQFNGEIALSKQKIEINNETYDRYTKEIEDLETRNKELEKEKEEREQKKTGLYQNKEKFEKELREKEEELKKYTQTLSEKDIEIEEKKKTLQNNIDKKYEIVAEIKTQKANFDNLCKNEKNAKNELQDIISELDSTRDKRQEIQNGFYEVEKLRNNIQKELDGIKAENEDMTSKLKEFDDKIASIETDYRIKESRKKFLEETEREKEGYTKAVKALMVAVEKNNNLSKGVHGVLANLISVDKKYETAIEMVLGNSLQNVVTYSEEEAKKLINYLRDNNLGRASFLPITTVKGQKLTDIKSAGISGIVGVASDLIETEKVYEGIVLNLLGRTVVVDTIENAVSLAKQNSYKFKIVTLKGDIVNPSGSMSGGSVPQKTVSILGRGKEIESLASDLSGLKKEIDRLQNEKNTYSETISEKLKAYEEKQQEMQNFEITYATEKQKVDSIDEEIKKLETKLSKIKENIEKINTEKEENTKTQEEFNTQIEVMEKENEELSKVIKEEAELNKDNQKYIDDLNFDITNLKISVSSFDESEESINEIVDRINQDIEKNQKSIEAKNQDKEKLIENNKENEINIERLVKAIEDIEKEILGSSSKLEKLKIERTEKSKKISSLEKDIDNQVQKIEEIKNKISRVDLKKSKIELELNQVINKMWDEYELTPNNTDGIEKAKNVGETQRKVDDIRENIKELGSINIDSIKEYQATKDRYDFMCVQRLDLEDSSNKLKLVIEEMTDTMKKQFAEQFKIINKNFEEVFKELFGGGKAELRLEDESNILECGIDITVQPPGKKLQNMLLLSGGERAFTAIALLFAILRINPAPFCVLDEIEAALDDVNVYRFAEYLKKFSVNSQFLIITHRKGTMEAADTVYGITMEEKGVSKLLSMKLA